MKGEADTTTGDLVLTTARRLAAAGIELASLEARLLVGHALEASLETVIAHPERAVTGSEAEIAGNLAARRESGEPLAYILGKREFWSLPFQVTPDVLIPRPETEVLVETALRLTPAAGSPIRILDLGTGSGCILLALLSERPAARGVGVDRSQAALRIAQDNALRLGLAHRCAFVCAHWGSALTSSFDLIVTNPPYIGSGDYGAVDDAVRRFEPAIALSGGSDGLDAYRSFGGDVARLLARGGHAVVEVGAGQAETAEVVLASRGLRAIATGRDLAGRERCLTCVAC
jgi:release factor glutamine methyltransferase